MENDMVATYEISFSKKFMIDDDTLSDEFGGSWEKFLNYIVKENGIIGIFDSEDFKLVRVREKRNEK